MTKEKLLVVEFEDADRVFEADGTYGFPFKEVLNAQVVIYKGKVLKNRNGPAFHEELHVTRG